MFSTQLFDDECAQSDAVFLALDAGSFQRLDASVVKVFYLAGDVVDGSDKQPGGAELVKNHSNVCHDWRLGEG